jgi:hypothetical protein
MMASRTGSISPPPLLATSNALPRATRVPVVTSPVSPGDAKACSRGFEAMSAHSRGKPS